MKTTFLYGLVSVNKYLGSCYQSDIGVIVIKTDKHACDKPSQNVIVILHPFSYYQFFPFCISHPVQNLKRHSDITHYGW